VEHFQERVLADKPDIIQNDDFVNKKYEEIRFGENRRTLKIVHISDPHIDLEYAEGSNWLCESYLCCRAEWGFPDQK